MKEKMGVNAGLVWNILNDGAKDLKALKKATKMSEKDLYAALGWLAREEKVVFTETETEVLISLA
ncbi:MAG TPA: winged helix-turn-helix domain-containing protein [Paludibacteraceae bacterium]|nr:winged helix-turn-helix domain-containing protein [Paludibacteraceae bacterium]